jgi:hypothetical protein
MKCPICKTALENEDMYSDSAAICVNPECDFEGKLYPGDVVLLEVTYKDLWQAGYDAAKGQAATHIKTLVGVTTNSHINNALRALADEVSAMTTRGETK